MGESQCRPLEFWRWPCHLEPHIIHLLKIGKIILDMLLSPGGQNAWPWDTRYQNYPWVGLFVVAVVQSLSFVWLFVTWWTVACQASLSFTTSQSLLKLMSIESVMPSNQFVLCHSLSSCLQSFPAWGSCLSLFFASGDQIIGASASALVLPVNIQGWFPFGLTDLIFLKSKGLSRVFFNTTVQKHNSSVLNFLYSSTLISIYDYWKNHNFD